MGYGILQGHRVMTVLNSVSKLISEPKMGVGGMGGVMSIGLRDPDRLVQELDCESLLSVSVNKVFSYLTCATANAALSRSSRYSLQRDV